MVEVTLKLKKFGKDDWEIVKHPHYIQADDEEIPTTAPCDRTFISTRRVLVEMHQGDEGETYDDISRLIVERKTI